VDLQGCGWTFGGKIFRMTGRVTTPQIKIKY